MGVQREWRAQTSESEGLSLNAVPPLAIFVISWSSYVTSLNWVAHL